MSLSCVFSIDFSCDEFNIIVEAEDAGDEQEGLPLFYPTKVQKNIEKTKCFPDYF
jgi:hypothetical protein